MGGAIELGHYEDMVISGCLFSGNTAGNGGAIFGGGSEVTTTIRDCEFTDNIASSNGAAIEGYNATLVIEDCTFQGNEITRSDRGIINLNLATATVTNCRMTENTGAGPVIRIGNESGITIETCIIDGNTSSGDTSVIDIAENSSCTLESSTLYANNPSAGGASIYVQANAQFTMDQTIIAGTTELAMICESSATLAITCSDIYDNDGGNWTGDIASMLGQDGNISADPLFCDAAAGSFTLGESSPCAYSNSGGGCGLIGAESVACNYASHACCVDEVCSFLTNAACTAAGGVWEENEDACLPNPCLLEAACCINGACSLLASVECDHLDGEWDSGTTTCDPNPCPPVKACCHGGMCHVLTEASCNTLGGDWQSTENECTEGLCPENAACCIGDTCSFLSSAACISAGGTWHEGYGCGGGYECGLLRACCNDLNCELTWMDDCVDSGGSFYVITESCDPNPCTAPAPQTSWGHIKTIYRNNLYR